MWAIGKQQSRHNMLRRQGGYKIGLELAIQTPGCPLNVCLNFSCTFVTFSDCLPDKKRYCSLLNEFEILCISSLKTDEEMSSDSGVSVTSTSSSRSSTTPQRPLETSRSYTTKPSKQIWYSATPQRPSETSSSYTTKPSKQIS